jgi:hypothetical protein
MPGSFSYIQPVKAEMRVALASSPFSNPPMPSHTMEKTTSPIFVLILRTNRLSWFTCLCPISVLAEIMKFITCHPGVFSVT